MQIRKILTAAVMLGLALVLTACAEKPLLSEVSFSTDRITPNADNSVDVLKIAYRLSRSAVVSIYFEDGAGNRYYFRDHVRHAPSVEGPYEVYFSGVVDGYSLPEDRFEGFRVEKRVLQDGVYTWTVEAIDTASGGAGGAAERASGTLTIADADAALPELRGFSVFPPVFTPNRDGIGDRATINVFLTKDVEELITYLEGEDGKRYPVEWKEKLTPQNEAGPHEFDYDAGVDYGAEPPPDGTYTVTVQARDMVGQWTRATGTLAIADGGVPRAYILNGEVEWAAVSGQGSRIDIPLGSTLYFTLTIENNSNVPIRTSGPPPGIVYDSDQNFATLGELVQSGVFRVGVHCENSIIDHPWRWAVGGPADLVEVKDGGNTYTYLPAGKRAIVTGGIRFLDVMGARNPQYCYAALIHEDVEISLVNYRVDPVQLTIQVP